MLADNNLLPTYKFHEQYYSSHWNNMGKINLLGKTSIQKKIEKSDNFSDMLVKFLIQILVLVLTGGEMVIY